MLTVCGTRPRRRSLSRVSKVSGPISESRFQQRKSTRINWRCGSLSQGPTSSALGRCGHPRNRLVSRIRSQAIKEGDGDTGSGNNRRRVDSRSFRLPDQLTYLIEKGRIAAIARERLVRALDDSSTPCRLAPLDRAVADALESVSRNEVPDLPDRIVSATAVALGVPLVSRDGKIRLSQVETIW